MLTIFKNIRRKESSKESLGTNGSPLGRYLKYALGEIVLVVIGILIALQINTWRMEKEYRQTEQTLLKNLKKDLERDIGEFDNVSKLKSEQNAACLRLLEYFIDDSKPVDDTIELVNDLQIIMYFILPSETTTTFDLAKSTGHLNYITNDNLIADLSFYFNDKQLEGHVTETKRFTNSYVDNNILTKYPMFSKNVRAHDGLGGTYELSRYQNDSRQMKAFPQMRKDISVENYLNSFSVRLTIGLNSLVKRKQWAKDMIQRIDQQIVSKE